jgi:hypothetical protein
MTISYQIIARDTGHCLGIYEGVTDADAVEAMHIDAGYAGSGEAAAALETTVEALRAQLDVRAVRIATDDDVAHVVGTMLADDYDAMIIHNMKRESPRTVWRRLLAASTEAECVSCDWPARLISLELLTRGLASTPDTIDRVRDAYVAQLIADAASEADVEAMMADDLEVAS